MLTVHILVKVQLNGDPRGTADLAEQLVEGTGAGLVDVQGRTILLSKGEDMKFIYDAIMLYPLMGGRVTFDELDGKYL